MSVVTPLLYEAIAENEPDRLPRLRAEPVNVLREQLGEQAVDLERLSAGVRNFLRAVPFATAVEDGAIGIPMLDSQQFATFVARAATGTDPRPRRGRWWEFWETERGSLALFHADDDEVARVAVTLPVVTRRGTQLRSLDLGPAGQADGTVTAGPPFTPREPCVLATEVQQPGRSYSGICRREGCSSGCDEDLWLNPNEGRYELVGCLCPAARPSEFRILAGAETLQFHKHIEPVT